MLTQALRRYQYRALNIKRRLFYVFIIGVVLHEIAHVVMCKLAGVETTNVVLFSPDPPGTEQGVAGGTVEYRTHKYRSAALVSIAPVLLNLPLGIGILAVLATRWPPYLPEEPLTTPVALGGLLLALGSSWIAINALYQAPASEKDLAGVRRSLWIDITIALKHPLSRGGNLLALPILLVLLLPPVLYSSLINRTEAFFIRELITIGLILGAIQLGQNWEIYADLLETILKSRIDSLDL